MLGCYWHFWPYQEMKNLSNEIENGVKRREYYECRRKFLLESRFKVCEIRECDWWKKVKNNVDGAGDYMKTTYSYQKPISENNLNKNIKSSLKFGVVDCSIEVPERLKRKTQWIWPYIQELWSQFGKHWSAQEGFCTWT